MLTEKEVRLQKHKRLERIEEYLRNLQYVTDEMSDILERLVTGEKVDVGTKTPKLMKKYARECVKVVKTHIDSLAKEE